MNVPKEIDELMWEIAETKDDALQTQFVLRYPGFAQELEKRKIMVSDLKGSRPNKEPALFVPSQEVRNFGPSRASVVAASVVFIASATFAAYATVKYLNKRQINQHVAPIAQVPIESIAIKKQPLEEIPFNELPQSNAIGSLQPETQETQRIDPYLTKITVQSEKTTLTDVINEIANQAGLTITMAPGYEEKTIFILYENQPAIGVLNDLGLKYGFTVFPQGKGEVLIVPARGSGSINAVSADGVANELSNKERVDIKKK